MPVRIYALAKELKLDSGELSDVCARAGVTGKGSALASLTDDEAAKIKSYLAGGAKPAAKVDSGMHGSATEQIKASATDSGALRREDYVAPAGAGSGRPMVISTTRESAAVISFGGR